MNKTNQSNTTFRGGSAILWFLIGSVVAGIVCFYVGFKMGANEVSHYVYVEESDVANEIIGSSPEYSALFLLHGWKGDVKFGGAVPTQEAYSKLKSAVSDQFGRMKLEQRMKAVKVKE